LVSGVKSIELERLIKKRGENVEREETKGTGIFPIYLDVELGEGEKRVWLNARSVSSKTQSAR